MERGARNGHFSVLSTRKTEAEKRRTTATEFSEIRETFIVLLRLLRVKEPTEKYGARRSTTHKPQRPSKRVRLQVETSDERRDATSTGICAN